MDATATSHLEATPDLDVDVEGEERRHEARLVETGRIAAMANHELRQPLLGIKAFSAMIADRRDAPDEVREWAKKIQSQALRLERIVAGLRDLSRPARSPRRRVLLDEAVAEVLGFATFLFREPRVHFAEALRSGARVDVSTDELTQVVLNLLANARDAVVGRGGGRVQVASHVEDGWACLLVADDGPGLSAAQRADLDRAFCSTKADGVGLGLKVSRDIARSHGGSLDVLDLGDGPDVLDALPPLLERPVVTVFRLRLRAV